MKIHAVLACALTAGLLAAFAGTAAAQADQTPGPSGDPLVFSPYQRIFIPVDIPPAAPPPGTIEHAPPHRVLFLNNCKPNGCVVKPGNGQEDSRANRSAIVRGSTNRTLAAYTGSQATWNQIVQCVRETYAQFNIGVTDVDPCPNPDAGCSTGHWEAMAAGLPTQVGFPNGVAGVAPFTCGVIPNAITFSFINLFPSDVNEACWTIAQETAHAFGLSHEMLGPDPMTYIQSPARKRFQDQTACIGTQGCCQPAQECQCGPTEQNSVQMLLGIFGTSTPTPPVVAITAPGNNATVTPGFPIHATATDEHGVAKVDLLIDGQLKATLTTAPYAFNGPMDLAQGTHTIVVKATDTQGAEGQAQITVILGEPCDSAADCRAQGEGLVCVDGRCVPGPDNPGGLGTSCTSGADCASGLCVDGADGMVCSESCDPNANACPDDFRCASSGAGTGFCYPGGGGGCLGCSTDGGDPTLPLGIGVVAAGLLIRRRRKAA